MIRARNLTKTYPGGVLALDGVDLWVGKGEMVALLGANGSGKTTLLRLLAGRLPPTSGELSVLGEEPSTASPGMRGSLGFAPQQPELDPEMTGRQTLEMMAALYGLPKAQARVRWRELADRLELSGFLDRAVGTYSGGQRQRLSLALALQHEPDLLLLDEPTSGLDAHGRAGLWKELGTFRRGGGAVAVVSHDLAGVEEHADRVLVLHQGKTVASGSPEEVRRIHARPSWALRFSAPPPSGFAGALQGLEAVEAVEAEGVEVTVYGPLVPSLREELLRQAAEVEEEAQIRLESLRRREPDLAAAFRALTGVSVSALRAQEGKAGGRRRSGGGQRAAGAGWRGQRNG